MGWGERYGGMRLGLAWPSRRATSSVVFAIALGIAAVWLFRIHSHLTFIADDWALLVSKQGSGVRYFLDPFNENILIGPALVYKLLLATVGMESAGPYFAVATLLFLASAGLLFVLLRRRVDDWLALLGAVLVLFLGAAFEDLLWAFQLGYFASMTAGLAMLIALERDNERADGFACALLVAAVAFSSLGITFIAAAVVAVGMGQRPRLRRIYIPLLPLSLYALWWAGWGHTAESNLSVHNAANLPSYVYNAGAAGMTSLLGLATGDGSEPSQPHLIWGKLMLIAVVGATVWRIYRDRGLSAGLAVALTLPLVFWISAGMVRDEGRLPTSSRYQYISAIFLMLVLAESLRGVRLPALAIGLMAVVTALAISGGVSLLQREYEERWRPTGETLRASLAAVEMAGANANPSFRISFAPEPVTTARKYLEIARSFGSAGYSPEELAGQSESNRGIGDLTLAQALDLALKPTEAVGRNCETLTATASGATGLTLLRGGFTFENRSNAPVEPMLARFADDFSVFFGSIEPGVRTSLRIPVDGVSRPWRLGLRGSGPVRLCVS